MRRHFFVAGQAEDGKVEKTPLKEWLRHHPAHIPAGLDPDQATTWTITARLKTLGWTATETPTEVRLTMPRDKFHGSAVNGSQTTRAAASKITEDEFARKLVSEIEISLQPHKVECKRSLLYELSVDHHGDVAMGVDPDTGTPIRGGGHGFEQDILVYDLAAGGRTSVVPLIVAEVKFGRVTTHDVIVYAEQADRIRRVYPYLRYGFVLGGMPNIPGRVLRLGQRFDFIVSLSAELLPDELNVFRKLMCEEVQASVALTELLFGKQRSRLLQKRLLAE